VNGDEITANASEFVVNAGRVTMTGAAVTETRGRFTMTGAAVTETRRRFIMTGRAVMETRSRFTAPRREITMNGGGSIRAFGGDGRPTPGWKPGATNGCPDGTEDDVPFPPSPSVRMDSHS
jgi:hypothetical protein